MKSDEMRRCEEKLVPSDRIYFQRAIETFPEEKGNCSDDITEFILNIFEVNDKSNQSFIQNAVNFIRTWSEVGLNFPQRVMDLLFYVSFKHPFFLSQLAALSSSYSNSGWLFHSLLALVQDHTDLFKESIFHDFPVWEFILQEFDRDFFTKSDVLSTPYSDRPYSFLCESILFGWPARSASSVSGAAASLAGFLSSARSRALS